MFVRKFERRTTRNIAIQIVRNDRTKEGRMRRKIVHHMGTAPEGPALDELLRAAKRERLRIEEDRHPSLFSAEQSASVILAARNRKQSEEPIPLADIRKLVEAKRVCVGFHEVFGALYARLFRQAVLLRLATPGGSKLAHARLTAV